MKKQTMHNAALLAAMAALLAACGGGGGGGEVFTAPPANTTTTTEVPSSAQSSMSGLIAYLNDLIGNRTNDTSEPVVLGDAVLPKDETSEPLAIN